MAKLANIGVKFIPPNPPYYLAPKSIEEINDFKIESIIIINGLSTGCRTSKFHKRINVYSFSVEPEQHQPSGTCNFSRINNVEFILYDDTSLKDINGRQISFSGLGTEYNIYAVNYNILRIMSGMSGLAYSN